MSVVIDFSKAKARLSKLQTPPQKNKHHCLSCSKICPQVQPLEKALETIHDALMELELYRLSSIFFLSFDFSKSPNFFL